MTVTMVPSWIALAFAIPVAVSGCDASEGRPDPGTVAFVHVTVVDVRRGIGIDDRTVIVRDARIEAVGPSSEIEPPPGALVVDATGRWMIPGLWDMHVHPDDPEMWHLDIDSPQRDLFIPQFPLWGVTGVRDMGGGWETIVEWRRRIALGTLLGPRIVAGGPLVDGPEPLWPGSIAAGTAEEGRAAVDSVIALGVDFVKVYQLLPREAYFAVAERAKASGIPFAGHVPSDLSTIEASEAGQASIEHAFVVAREAADPEAVEAAVAGITDPEARRVALMEAVHDHYDRERAEWIFKILIENGTWVDPTLLVGHRQAFFDPDEPSVVARLPYMPAYVRRWWTPAENVHLRDRSPAFERMMRARYRSVARIVGEMRAAGFTRFLVGTDTGGNPHTFPGSGVHDEMALLVEAGLEPAEALRAATLNPVEFLGFADSLGTVEVGKVADLVLLEADPLVDVANAREIAGVVVDGRWIDARERVRLLDRLRRLAAGEPPDVDP